jgi:hypothetical protein
VVLNKIDLLSDSPAFGAEDQRIVRVFALSCATGEGVEEFRRALFELVPAAQPMEEEAAVPDFLVYRPRPKARPYRIFRTERGYRITGTPPEGEELEEALRSAGARKGAEVEIGDEVFELA